jgi:hypothetical protein
MVLDSAQTETGRFDGCGLKGTHGRRWDGRGIGTGQRSDGMWLASMSDASTALESDSLVCWTA